MKRGRNLSEQLKPFRLVVTVIIEDVPSLVERKLRAELLHYKARDLGLLSKESSEPFSGVRFFVELDSSFEKRKALRDFLGEVVKYKGFMEAEIPHNLPIM